MSKQGSALALFSILVVVLAGMGLDIMEVDAAQYAGMSRDMLHRGDLLKLYFRGEDYLDKPPMLFWLSALSFELFGVHNWSYRLPSVLFAAFGMYATYRFALLFHGTRIARLAAIIFGSSVAFALMTNDVRCDTILTSAVITAVWCASEWLRSERWIFLIASGLAIGTGMLVKGPIAGVAVVLAIGGHLILSGTAKRIVDPRWLLAVLVTACMLLPMCVGLYEQHGWHGIRFFFWEQSFGRITGENRWKDDSTLFYFTHEILWQMLPWTLLVLTGLWKDVVALVRKRPLAEYASPSAAILLFVALSLSHFKLPHYLYITLPFFAVIGARALDGQVDRWVILLHYMLLALLWSLAMTFVVIVFPEESWPFVVLLLVALAVAVILVKKKGTVGTLLANTVIIFFCVGVTLNVHFYPNLLVYQANAKAGQWAASKELSGEQFFALQTSGTALDFYAGYPVTWLSDPEEARVVIHPGVVIYTSAAERDRLLKAGVTHRSEVVLPNYPIQVIGVDFLFPQKRQDILETKYLLNY